MISTRLPESGIWQRNRSPPALLTWALPTNCRSATARGYLLEGPLDEADVRRLARELLADEVVEQTVIGRLGDAALNTPPPRTALCVHVLPKPGVMDPVALSAENAIADFNIRVDRVRTLKKIWLSPLEPAQLQALCSKVLANDSIEQVVIGPLDFRRLDMGQPYEFQLIRVPIRELDDAALEQLSRTGQLYLSLTEMQTIQQHYRQLDRDPTDVELETLAQTWSEHCSHKTLAGRIAYRDDTGPAAFRQHAQGDHLRRHSSRSGASWAPRTGV